MSTPGFTHGSLPGRGRGPLTFPILACELLSSCYKGKHFACGNILFFTCPPPGRKKERVAGSHSLLPMGAGSSQCLISLLCVWSCELNSNDAHPRRECNLFLYLCLSSSEYLPEWLHQNNNRY